jgi:hypothetical protein
MTAHITSPEGTCVLVDIENLAGGPAASEEDFRQVWEVVRRHAVRFDDSTRTIVGASAFSAQRAFFALGDTPAQRLVRNGPDGAELAILDAVSPEELALRFRRVVIASGDGRFAPLARSLRDLGVEVALVVGRGAPSWHLLRETPFRIWLRIEGAPERKHIRPRRRSAVAPARAVRRLPARPIAHIPVPPALQRA